MRYTELILEDYKRLSLNDIKRVVYRPKSPIQLILGTNGSGKSSLLKELSPLPANLKQEYGSNGYKKITIEKDGKTYVLVSEVVNKKNRHSFKIDDEELNSSGTRAIQLKLVEEHFRITPEIHELMIGVTGLTTMSVASRKQWFTKMSNTDYRFAISVYEKLSVQYRDIVGSMRHLNKRLAQEEQTSLSEKDINETIEEIAFLNEYVDKLMLARVKSIPNLSNVTLGEVDERKKTLLTLLETLSEDDLQEDTQALVNELKGQRSALKRQYSELSEKVEKQKEKQKERSQLLSTNIDALVSAKKKLEEEIERLKESVLVCPNDFGMAEDISQLYKTVYESITEYFNHLPPTDESAIWTRENYTEKKERLTKVNNELIRLDERMTKCRFVIEEQEHKSKCEDTQCPKCGHKWIPGYNKERLTKTKQILDNLIVVCEKLSKEKESLEQWLDQCESIFNLLQQLKQIIKNNKSLYFVWEKTFSNPILKNRAEIERKLHKVLMDTKTWKKINNYLSKRDKIISDIDYLKTEETYKTAGDEKSLMDAENKLHDITRELLEIDKKINHKRSLMETKKSFYSAIEALSLTIRRYTKEQKDTLVELRNQYIDSVIAIVRDRIRVLDEQVVTYKNKDHHLKALQQQISDLKKEESILKIMIDGLSPTKGLIGKNIVRFIEHVLKEMSDILSRLWSYDLEILSCKIQEDDNHLDLDYRFPLIVNRSNMISDISKASTSMREVIDLAFKMVASKHLGMDGTILYLDEFGRSFDEQHRKNAYSILETITASSFDQIFIVSHYKESYGRYVNSEISILSPDNIDTDAISTYNEVLQIEHT